MRLYLLLATLGGTAGAFLLYKLTRKKPPKPTFLTSLFSMYSGSNEEDFYRNYGGPMDITGAKITHGVVDSVLGSLGVDTYEEKSAFWNSSWNPISYFKKRKIYK
jgi:hypothetical protein